MEQLLCAMLMLRGLPSGAEDWKNIADRMPDKADGSGEKPNHEAVRGMLFLYLNYEVFHLLSLDVSYDYKKGVSG
jgi:hypothetical protein